MWDVMYDFYEGAYMYWSLVLLKKASDDMDVRRVFVIVLLEIKTELLSTVFMSHKTAVFHCGTHKFLRFM